LENRKIGTNRDSDHFFQADSTLSLIRKSENGTVLEKWSLSPFSPGVAELALRYYRETSFATPEKVPVTFSV